MTDSNVRMSPQQVRERVMSGDALLVCAYEDPGKCKKYTIEGSISYSEFEDRLDGLDKSAEVIFYCT